MFLLLKKFLQTKDSSRDALYREITRLWQPRHQELGTDKKYIYMPFLIVVVWMWNVPLPQTHALSYWFLAGDIIMEDGGNFRRWDHKGAQDPLHSYPLVSQKSNSLPCHILPPQWWFVQVTMVWSLWYASKLNLLHQIVLLCPVITTVKR